MNFITSCIYFLSLKPWDIQGKQHFFFVPPLNYYDFRGVKIDGILYTQTKTKQ